MCGWGLLVPLESPHGSLSSGGVFWRWTRGHPERPRSQHASFDNDCCCCPFPNSPWPCDRGRNGPGGRWGLFSQMLSQQALGLQEATSWGFYSPRACNHFLLFKIKAPWRGTNLTTTAPRLGTPSPISGLSWPGPQRAPKPLFTIPGTQRRHWAAASSLLALSKRADASVGLAEPALEWTLL